MDTNECSVVNSDTYTVKSHVKDCDVYYNEPTTAVLNPDGTVTASYTISEPAMNFPSGLLNSALFKQVVGDNFIFNEVVSVYTNVLFTVMSNGDMVAVKIDIPVSNDSKPLKAWIHIKEKHRLLTPAKDCRAFSKEFYLLEGTMISGVADDEERFKHMLDLTGHKKGEAWTRQEVIDNKKRVCLFGTWLTSSTVFKLAVGANLLPPTVRLGVFSSLFGDTLSPFEAFNTLVKSRNDHYLEQVCGEVSLGGIVNCTGFKKGLRSYECRILSPLNIHCILALMSADVPSVYMERQGMRRERLSQDKDQSGANKHESYMLEYSSVITVNGCSDPSVYFRLSQDTIYQSLFDSIKIIKDDSHVYHQNMMNIYNYEQTRDAIIKQAKHEERNLDWGRIKEFGVDNFIDGKKTKVK